MKMRKLGRSGIEVAPFGFGGNVFGWTADEKTSFSMLDRFVAGGFNLIDTADMYSNWVPGHVGGESEAMIGRWLKKNPGKRSQMVIATKVGMNLGPAGQGLSRSHIEKSIDQSLLRLQVDHIDLYQSHCDDLSVPMEETLGTYAKLVQTGKVRAIGASNFTAARLTEALRVSRQNQFPRYEVVQPLYNLCDRKAFEENLLGICTKEEIGVIPYYSLAAGFLTGKYRSASDLNKSPRGKGAVSRYLGTGLVVLAAVDLVAKRISATPTQVAIAWLNSKKFVTAPLASATSLAQLDEIIAGANLTLDSADVLTLDRASAGL